MYVPRKISLAIVTACLLAASTLLALAGSISVTMTTTGAPCAAGCTRTYTETDANLVKIVAAFQVGCNAKRNGTCTPVQVIAYWADQMISNTTSAVTSAERQALQEDAVKNYVPIDPK